VDNVSQTIISTSTCLGFLSIQQESDGSYLGGYLVTNGWGRPLEFRVSSAVHPNRIQQILYGGTLLSFLCADLIGKTLIEKTSARAQFLLTDHPIALELRLHFDTPVGWLPFIEGDTKSSGPANTASNSNGDNANIVSSSTMPGSNTIVCHAQYQQDADSFRRLATQLNGMDLAEPFARVREAIAEVKQVGVSGQRPGVRRWS
jgi:hypothetical protein